MSIVGLQCEISDDARERTVALTIYRIVIMIWNLITIRNFSNTL